MFASDRDVLKTAKRGGRRPRGAKAKAAGAAQPAAAPAAPAEAAEAKHEPQAAPKDEKEALLEQARRDREARQRAREQEARAVRLQAAARRWLAVRRLRREQEAAWDARAADLEKLLALNLPVATAATATAQLRPLVLCFPDDAARAQRLWATLLQPALDGNGGADSREVPAHLRRGFARLCLAHGLWDAARQPALAEHCTVGELRAALMRHVADEAQANDAPAAVADAVWELGGGLQGALPQLLSVPMLADRFSPELRSALACAPAFEAQLRSYVVNNKSAPLPPRPSRHCESHVWLLGNVARVALARPRAQWTPSFAEAWLALALDLLPRVPDAALATTGAAVAWEHEGVVSRPLVLPDALVEQLRLLVAPRLLHVLLPAALPFFDELADDPPPAPEGKAEEGEMAKLQAKARAPKAKKRGFQAFVAWAEKFTASSSWAAKLSSSSSSTRAEAKAESKTDPAPAANEQKLDERPPLDPRPGLLFAALAAQLLQRWPGQPTAPMLATLSFWTPTRATRHVSTALWRFLRDELPDVAALARDEDPNTAECRGPLAVAALFAAVYEQQLEVTDESELYELQRPLTLRDNRALIERFKWLLFEGVVSTATGGGTDFGGFLRQAVGRLLKALYLRDSRRPFCAPETWLVPDAERRGGASDRLLAHMPYALPFARRVQLFSDYVAAEREAARQTPGHGIAVRRAYLLEDAFRGISPLGPGGQLKKRLQVQFTSELGHAEAGIDAGGLFKDLWTELSQQAFDPNYGLFRVTADQQLLYPDPNSEFLHGPRHTDYLRFLGMVLGKALFEGVTVSPKFAHFFLSKLLGNFNYLDSLPSLDPELYKNLLFLKFYDGDAADLCLTFTHMRNDYGEQQEVPLVPGGAAIDVTNDNKYRYIHKIAHYLMNTQIEAQCRAFREGLASVIRPQWLALFNEAELQVVISGAEGDVAIDVDDLRPHVRFTGGYSAGSKHVDRFWKVVRELSPEDSALLLRFVTSCPRPPPLGFAALHPQFTIHRVGITSDDERLPSASTCFNTLKLPTYSSSKIMKKKLLMAIRSGAGFEMS